MFSLMSNVEVIVQSDTVPKRPAPGHQSLNFGPISGQRLTNSGGGPLGQALGIVAEYGRRVVYWHVQYSSTVCSILDMQQN